VRSTHFWEIKPLFPFSPLRFLYVHNPKHLCGDDPVQLLVLVTSSANGHAERREAVRATWGSAREGVRLLFLLGQGQDGQHAIDEEAAEFGDILQEDFKDAYHNLTLKTIGGLKWSSIFCPQAEFVMKTDDDIFVNVPLLLNSLQSESIFKESLVGCIKNDPRSAPQPIPSMDNPNVEFIPKPALPPFAAGAGYVIPGATAAAALYAASLETRIFPVEDVYTTAMCASRAGLGRPEHDGRFSCGEAVAENCHLLSRFTGHRMSPERMHDVNEALASGQCGHNLKML